MPEYQKKRSYLLFLFKTFNIDVEFKSLGFNDEDNVLVKLFKKPGAVDDSVGYDSNVEFLKTSLSSPVQIEENLIRLTPDQCAHFDITV